MSTTALRLPKQPHWLTAGFRPFFFLGALAMAVPVLVWVPVLLGALQLPTHLAPRDWHVHTMFFGAIPAIVAGFALTAVSNWTGRPPVSGGVLLALVLLWLAGRVAVSASALIGAPAAALIDLLFPVALVFVFAREVLGGDNRRNLRVVVIVALLGVANAAFHLEAMIYGRADYAVRAGASVILLLVMLIGGRIIPAFTRNWLAARRETRLPAPFSRLDRAALVLSAVALVSWTVLPGAVATGGLLIAPGIANIARLSRWRGLQTLSEPLLAILHVGFATVPLGFLLLGASILAPAAVDQASAIHVWTAGTFGAMTLAVMTRASRGHSGQPLASGRLELAIFTLVLIGAAARVAAPFAGGAFAHALEGAGLAWAAAFLLFAVGYGPMLLARPRMPTCAGASSA